LRDTVSTITAELRLIFRRRFLECGLVLRRSEAIDHSAVGGMKFFLAEDRFAIGEECHGVVTLDSDAVVVDVRLRSCQHERNIHSEADEQEYFYNWFHRQKLSD